VSIVGANAFFRGSSSLGKCRNTTNMYATCSYLMSIYCALGRKFIVPVTYNTKRNLVIGNNSYLQLNIQPIFHGTQQKKIFHFMYSRFHFTFHWSYTDVELVMYTFSIIKKQVYIQHTSEKSPKFGCTCT